MTGNKPIRAAGVSSLVAGLATLSLAVAACGSATTTTAPSPGAAASPALAGSPAESGGPDIASTTAAGQPQTIHVLEDPLNWSVVKLGTLTGCAETMGDDAGCLGDYVVGRSSLHDAMTNKTVGMLVTECFIVDAGSGRYHCPASTIALTGRGQIVFTENVLLGPHICPTCSFAPDADPSSGGLTVIGGSDALLGATLAESAGSTYPYGDWVITLAK